MKNQINLTKALEMRRGKESSKKQSYKDRRDERKVCMYLEIYLNDDTFFTLKNHIHKG